MSLYDRIVPSSACQWGRLTAVWPWQTVRGSEYATGGFILKGDPHPLTQADFPLIRFTDEPIDIAAVIAAGEGVDKAGRSISTTPPRRPWLPWRKRR